MDLGVNGGGADTALTQGAPGCPEVRSCLKKMGRSADLGGQKRGEVRLFERLHSVLSEDAVDGLEGNHLGSR